MSKVAILALATAMLAGGAAEAAETVIGSGRARTCYLDAERERTSNLAIENCTVALERDPLSHHDRVATHVNRGILLHRIGAFDKAIADYDRAMRLDPDQPEAYLNKAAALFKSEDRWREAIPLFTTALEKNTKRPEIAYFGRGLSNELAGNTRAAYADLKRAKQLAPDWSLPAQELTRYSVRPRG